MNETARKLLDAHVAFELRQWRGRTLEKHLRKEVKTFWAWAADTELRAVADARLVRDAARRLVLEIELDDELTATVADIARHLVAHPVNRKTPLKKIVGRDLFDRGVDLVAELDDLRERLIHRTLQSGFYRMLASDLLYRGIKDYLFSDQALLQRIPGVSSLLRKGAGTVNKRLPGLEAQIEKRVRAYLETNLQRTLDRSEAFLLATLTGERIRELAEDVWQAAADRQLALDDVLDDGEIDELAGFALQAWRHLRATDYVRTLVDAGIEHFFELWGDRPLTEVMAQAGIDRAVLEREALTLAPPVLDALHDSGYLEALIRRRLEPFYSSAAAGKILD